MTDASSNVVQTYVYDTFGKIVNQTGSIENPYTYTGREWDAEAGLYYYRARCYDPTLGRFINGDPIGFAGGDVNFYVYVQNNPINFIDPEGEFAFVLWIAAGAVVSGTIYYLFYKWANSPSYKDAVEANIELGKADGNPNTTIEDFVEKYYKYKDSICDELEEAELVIKLIPEIKILEQIKPGPRNPAKEIKNLIH